MIKVIEAGPVDVNGSGHYTVAAQTKAGEVYLLRHDWTDEFRCGVFARRVLERGTIDPDHWGLWRTVYGSAAFAAEEDEAHVYAEGLRRGIGREEDIPDNIRTML